MTHAMVDMLADYMLRESSQNIEKSQKNLIRVLIPVETFKEEFSALLESYNAKIVDGVIQFNNSQSLDLKTM